MGFIGKVLACLTRGLKDARGKNTAVSGEENVLQLACTHSAVKNIKICKHPVMDAGNGPNQNLFFTDRLHKFTTSPLLKL